jgi:biotin operon repressor
MPTLNNCMTALRVLSSRAGRRVAMKTLCEEMETSRATVMRTVEFLRVQLRIEITSYPDGGYCLPRRLAPVVPHDPIDRSFMVPGLRISEEEAYDLLRLLNASGMVDPGLLRLHSLRSLVKQVLTVTLPPKNVLHS